MASIKGAVSEISEAIVQPPANQIGQAVSEGLEMAFKGTSSQPKQNQQNPQAAAMQQVQDANKQRDEAQRRTNVIQFIERVKQGEQVLNQQKILKQQKDQAREQAEAEKMRSLGRVGQFEISSPGKGPSAAVSMERGKIENKSKKAA